MLKCCSGRGHHVIKLTHLPLFLLPSLIVSANIPNTRIPLSRLAAPRQRTGRTTPWVSGSGVRGLLQEPSSPWALVLMVIWELASLRHYCYLVFPSSLKAPSLYTTPLLHPLLGPDRLRPVLAISCHSAPAPRWLPDCWMAGLVHSAFPEDVLRDFMHMSLPASALRF